MKPQVEEILAVLVLSSTAITKVMHHTQCCENLLVSMSYSLLYNFIDKTCVMIQVIRDEKEISL